MRLAHVYKAKDMLARGIDKETILHYMSRWYTEAHVISCVSELQGGKKKVVKKKSVKKKKE